MAEKMMIVDGGGKVDKTNKFLGEGSYGCTFKPGLDCKGNKNRIKKSVNKITMIDFYSKNEWNVSKKVRKIPDYKERFAPVFKYCTIKYNNLFGSNLNMKKCENFMEHIDYDGSDGLAGLAGLDGLGGLAGLKNVNTTKFFMFYSRFVSGEINVKKFIMGLMKMDGSGKDSYGLGMNFGMGFGMGFGKIGRVIKNNKNVDYGLFNCVYFLANSIYILNSHDIIHNDLQNYNNILYDTTKNKPILIDYGLSYHKSVLYTSDFKKEDVDRGVVGGGKPIYDIQMMHKFFFSYKNYSCRYTVEKAFLTFFLSNNSDSHRWQSHVYKNNTLNALRKTDIDRFVDDVFSEIVGAENVTFCFSEGELALFKTSVGAVYNKFSDKKVYKFYDDIIGELMPNIFMYNDLYSTCIVFMEFLYVYFAQHKINYAQFVGGGKEPVLYLLIQMMKKNIFPDVEYRLTPYQFISIFEFIIKYMNDANDADSDAKLDFNAKFDTLLDVLKVNRATFTDPKYAFIDLNLLLTDSNIAYIKSLNIKFDT